MKTRSKKTDHIVGRVGKQETRPPMVSNQPGVQKCTTGSATSLGKHSDDNHAQGDLPAGTSRVTPTKKKKKRQTIKKEGRGL